jgi:hypothetical protein
MKFFSPLFKMTLTAIVSIALWYAGGDLAMAGNLQNRLATYPDWPKLPQMARDRGELIYPAWFEGTWLATSTLVEQIAPLAPKIVTPGFESNRPYLDRPIEFSVRFIPASGERFQSRFPLPIPQVKSLNSPLNIVADRAFNGANIARAYLGKDYVKSVKVDPQNPQRQITQLANNRQLISIATGFDRELPTADDFISSELSQQLFSGSPDLYLNTVEVTTNYHFKSTPQPTITAEQITAIYLSPQDPQYFQSGDRPVAIYRYDLKLRPAN